MLFALDFELFCFFLPRVDLPLTSNEDTFCFLVGGPGSSSLSDPVFDGGEYIDPSSAELSLSNPMVVGIVGDIILPG